MAEDALPSSKRAWLGVGVLSAFYVVSLLDRNLVTLLASAIKADLQLSDTQIGLLYGTAFSIFYVVAALPIGWALDRYDRRWIIWTGASVWSLGTAVCGLASTYAGLFAARGIVGAGEASIGPGGQSIIADSFPRRRLGLAMSIFSVGGKAGSGLSFLIGGLLTALIDPTLRYGVPLLGERSGWQVVFLIAGLPGILFAFLIFLVREPRRTRPTSSSPEITAYFRSLKDAPRFFLFHHATTMLLFASMASLVIWAPATLDRQYGLSPSAAGIWLSVALTFGPIAAMPVHGALADRWFSKGKSEAHILYLAIAALVATPLAVSTYLGNSASTALVLLGLSATLLSGYVGLPPSALQLVVPQSNRSKAASGLLIFQAFGTMIGSAAPAVINDQFFMPNDQIGLSIAIAVGVMLPVAALCAFLGSREMRSLTSPVSVG